MKNIVLATLFFSVTSMSAQLQIKKGGEVDFSTRKEVRSTKVVTNLSKFVSPEYKGGVENLVNFIKKHFRKPKNASKGYLELFFQVDESGELSNFTVNKSVNRYYDLEMIRVLKLTSSDWRPGSEDGSVAKLLYTLNIDFN